MLKKLLFLWLTGSFFYNASAQVETDFFELNIQDSATGNARFAIFNERNQFTEESFFQWLRSNYNISNEVNFELIKEEADEIGFVHKKFRQTINNAEIFSSMLIVHLKNDRVESFNGEYYKNAISTKYEIDENIAIKTALESHPLLKQMSVESNLQYMEIERKFCPLRVKEETTLITPCYAMKVLNEPLRVNEWILWDAKTNKLIEIQPLEVHADSNGRAVTHYKGTQNIKADFIGANNFRLRETGYRNVSTFKGTLNTDYFDSDNYWNNGTDKIAGDVHYGAELVHDYLKDYFNRNGYGNKDDTFKSITTSGSGNAFWNLGANTATFLVGSSGGVGPCASLDVVGHEYGHGIADESGGLLYSGEACAIHESFADISGHITEFYHDSATANWYIGEEVWVSSKGIRNMEDPHLFNDPKAYGGKFFPKGCHGSGGVQNRWFYLMVKGDTGVNEFNYSYSLKGLGHQPATQITYRNMFYYMIPQSTFKDAFYGTIKAAKDLYGGCSYELEHTFKAWKTVNVDDPTLNPVDMSHGIAAPSQVCVGVPVSVSMNSFGDKSRQVKWLINKTDSFFTQSISYNFKKTGYFPVVLETVTCGTVFKDSVTIAVNVLPNPTFMTPFDTACASEDSVLILNTTQNADPSIPLKYEWHIEPLDIIVSSVDLKTAFNERFTYKLTLKAYYQGGCWNKSSKEIQMIEVYKPNFEVLRNSCQGKSIKLNNLTDTLNKQLRFKWIFSDNDTVEGYLPTNKSLQAYGKQPIILSATSPFRGCTDTVMKFIEIYRNPEVDFESGGFCRNGLTQLVTKGKFFYDKDWSMWHVGYANPINKDTFMVEVGDSNTRIIGLTMSDKRGCSNSQYKQFNVEELSAGLQIADVCLGTPSKLNYKLVSGSPYKLTFDFGNGETSEEALEEYTFNSPGMKNVKLTINNSTCRVIENASTHIKDKPVSKFQVVDACYGDSVNFVNQTQHSDSIYYQWLFADGNVSSDRNPKNFYTANTTKTYIVTLKSAFNNGCRDSISKPLTITETPICGFTVQRDPMNGNNAFIFKPNVIGPYSYHWDFGNGVTGSDTVAKYQYLVNGVFNVSLQISNEADCECESEMQLNAGFLENPVISLSDQTVIYPNPFNNELIFEISLPYANFKMTDVTGKIVRQGKLINGRNVLQVSDLVRGAYMIEVLYDGTSTKTKLIKVQ